MTSNPAPEPRPAWRARLAALTAAEKRAGALLAALILLAIGLRLIRLGEHSFWYDEASTYVHLLQPDLGALLKDLSDGWQQPVYFILAYALKPWLGTSEVALRATSVLAGALAVPAGFLLGRRMFGVGAGLLLAAMLAVLRIPVYYGQFARPYAWAILFTLLATHYWWGWLTDIRQGRAWSRRSILMYLLFGLLAAYTHAFSLFLLPFMAAWIGLACLRNGGLLKAVGWNALFVPGYGLWLGPLLAGAQSRPSHGEWLAPNRGTLVYTYKILFNNSEYRQFENLPFVLGIGLLGLALALAVWRAARRGVRRGFWDLALSAEAACAGLAFGPVLGLYAWSLTVYSLFSVRYTAIIAAFVYLLAARGLMAVPLPRLAGLRAGGLRAGLAVLWMGFLLFDLLAVDGYYIEPTRPDTRGVLAGILAAHETYPQPFVALCAAPEGLVYYLDRWGAPDPVDVEFCPRGPLPPLSPQALEAAALDAGAHTLVVGYSLSGLGEDSQAYLSARYCVAQRDEFYRGNVTVYDLRRGPDCA